MTRRNLQCAVDLHRERGARLSAPVVARFEQKAAALPWQFVSGIATGVQDMMPTSRALDQHGGTNFNLRWAGFQCADTVAARTSGSAPWPG